MELNANVSGFRNAVFALVVEWAKHRTDRLTAAVERTERAAAKKAVQCILLPFLCVRSLVTVRSLLFGNAVGRPTFVLLLSSSPLMMLRIS